MRLSSARLATLTLVLALPITACNGAASPSTTATEAAAASATPGATVEPSETPPAATSTGDENALTGTFSLDDADSIQSSFQLQYGASFQVDQSSDGQPMRVATLDDAGNALVGLTLTMDEQAVKRILVVSIDSPGNQRFQNGIGFTIGGLMPDDTQAAVGWVTDALQGAIDDPSSSIDGDFSSGGYVMRFTYDPTDTTSSFMIEAE